MHTRVHYKVFLAQDCFDALWLLKKNIWAILSNTNLLKISWSALTSDHMIGSGKLVLLVRRSLSCLTTWGQRACWYVDLKRDIEDVKGNRSNGFSWHQYAASNPLSLLWGGGGGRETERDNWSHPEGLTHMSAIAMATWPHRKTDRQTDMQTDSTRLGCGNAGHNTKIYPSIFFPK